MKKFYPIIIIILAGIISACSTLHANNHLKAKTPGQLRIVTFNINWGKSDWILTAPYKTINAIRKTNADIVFLQETTPEWQHKITPRLRTIYPYIKFRHYPGASGLAVLSKFPFHTTYYGYPGIGWHPGWIMIIKTSIGKIQFANLHLQPPLVAEGKMGFLLSGYFAAPMTRLKEVKFYYQRLNPRLTTIIVGDFNEGNQGYAAKFFRKHGFIDVLINQQVTSYTWKWKLGPVTLSERLDHMFCSRNLRPTKVQILHEGDSDHYPLIVDFMKA